MKPITPAEVRRELPEGVYKIFNALIQKHWKGSSARFTQDEAVAHLEIELNMHRSELFKEKLLDIEESYGQAGWIVTYDSPAYCETYAATFTFHPKK